jgi:hypothetical protein
MGNFYSTDSKVFKHTYNLSYSVATNLVNDGIYLQVRQQLSLDSKLVFDAIISNLRDGETAEFRISSVKRLIFDNDKPNVFVTEFIFVSFTFLEKDNVKKYFICKGVYAYITESNKLALSLLSMDILCNHSNEFESYRGNISSQKQIYVGVLNNITSILCIQDNPDVIH